MKQPDERKHRMLWLEIDGEQVAVDEEIVPLVIALNELPDIRTLQSCQDPPYIMFRGLYGDTERATARLADWLIGGPLARQSWITVSVELRWMTGKLPVGMLRVYMPAKRRREALKRVTETLRRCKSEIEARRLVLPPRGGADPWEP
jgi:hypothetical protein